MTWRRLGLAAASVPEGTMRDVDVDGRAVLVLRQGGQLFAFQGRCPHEEGTLAEGSLEPGQVVCPLHGATFAVPSGQILADPDGVRPPSGDVPSLRTFPTRLVAGEVEVDLP
jgi:nitrite reductase/ring-hydroxylating ferredoxin subunit